MTGFLEHPGFVLLSSLDLPADDFAVAGSGPLFARGWIAEIGDVDVVARGPAWTRASEWGEVHNAPFAAVKQIPLFDGQVEIFDGWFPEIWDVHRLIDQADVIDGVRFVGLDVVAETAKLLRRPRDEFHLRVLERHGWPK